MMKPDLPLSGVTVLEFCQYLSGPSAGLRLADLGARVIKIESPKGDACRKLAIENLWADENDSLLFHTINRNKDSFVANLKDEADQQLVLKLIGKSDILIHNFRPGVMEKLGFGYDKLKEIYPELIYAVVSGYGTEGPWSSLPGQDLLIQAKTGLMYTSGNYDDPPVPFGIAIADIICGAHLVQGILAALIRRNSTKKGALIEVSLLESLLDFQFELLTTYFQSGELPIRSKSNNGHTLLGAPYGLHKTKDGYIAIAMVSLSKLTEVLPCEQLNEYSKEDVFNKRDEIKQCLASVLITETSMHWIKKMRAHDLWAMQLTDWKTLSEYPVYQQLDFELKLDAEKDISTTRYPIQLNGKKLKSAKAAPKLGQNTEAIIAEFELKS